MEIFNESTIQKEKFRNVANKLLNHSFIVKRKEDSRKDYIFILQNKSYFEQYFDLLGYELKVNENTEVVALHNITGTGRLRLKKIESILLLILRLLYIERRNELGLHDDVIILAESIYEKYGMLKIDSKSNIDKRSLKESLRIFKRYNLISTFKWKGSTIPRGIYAFFSIDGKEKNRSIELVYNGETYLANVLHESRLYAIKHT